METRDKRPPDGADIEPESFYEGDPMEPDEDEDTCHHGVAFSDPCDECADEWEEETL